NLNLNVTNIAFVPVPIPLPFPWSGEYDNEFRSVVATKVIQQYGILKSVKSFNEGAVTVVKNEYFDPQTGQEIITSVNNEYNDLEYNVNYPAYWAVKGMSPAYTNTGFEEAVDSIRIDTNFVGTVMAVDNIANYSRGDKLL